MTDLDTNRLRNWAKAYQRLMQGGLNERAHTACIDDFAADDGEFPYITAEDVLMLLGEVDHLRLQLDAWKRIATMSHQPLTKADLDAAEERFTKRMELQLSQGQQAAQAVFKAATKGNRRKGVR